MEDVPSLGSVLLRPVQASDAPALERFFEALDPADVHSRFFAGRHGAPPGYVAGLARADFTHDIVILAFALPFGELLGGARVVEMNGTAELAITIRSDLKHHGLGRLLGRAVLDHARSCGMPDIHADILADNRASIGLARQLGFAFHRHPRAPALVRASLHL